VDGRSLKPPLLLYLSNAGDRQRMAVAPALGAVAEAAGYAFDCYYDTLRSGRHFGGGDPELAPPGAAGGSLVAGGRHAERAARLATRYEVVALGDPDSVLWPPLEGAGAEVLVRSDDPAELYEAVFARLERALPPLVFVLDASPQGAEGVVAAPYLYPALLSGGPALGLDVLADAALRARLEAIGAGEFRGLFVDPARAAAFPGGLESMEGEVENQDYAELTAVLAERHAGWGRGVLLGDPQLVAAQLPRARRLRLLPLYGRPQTEVIRRTEAIVSAATEPVFGRQYDDQDFFALAGLGHGLQVVDPDPPFDSGSGLAAAISPPRQALADSEPDDDELRSWAAEERVLVTILFWAGMVRELHCLPSVLDLVAATGLRAGLIVTAETLEHADAECLQLVAAPIGRGGVFGLVEPLLGSTGRGVAAETLLPTGALAASLAEARTAAAARLPEGLRPRGWWPLLDAPLEPSRERRVGWRSGRPVVRFTPRGAREEGADGADGARGTDLRGLAGRFVRGLGANSLFEEKRPFDGYRPGGIDASVADAVRNAGFEYMWTKAAYGEPSAVLRYDDFVALPFTAGKWDGWSPFYTLSGARDVVTAERRLLRRRLPGWLASTIDTPLWLLPAELLERGAELYRLAELVAGGGRSGRLVNVTPNVVARYARLVAERTARAG
jgi:hypothetical protein